MLTEEELNMIYFAVRKYTDSPLTATTISQKIVDLQSQVAAMEEEKEK